MKDVGKLMLPEFVQRDMVELRANGEIGFVQAIMDFETHIKYWVRFDNGCYDYFG